MVTTTGCVLFAGPTFGEAIVVGLSSLRGEENARRRAWRAGDVCVLHANGSWGRYERHAVYIWSIVPSSVSYWLIPTCVDTLRRPVSKTNRSAWQVNRQTNKQTTPPPHDCADERFTTRNTTTRSQLSSTSISLYTHIHTLLIVRQTPVYIHELFVFLGSHAYLHIPGRSNSSQQATAYCSTRLRVLSTGQFKRKNIRQ